MSELKVYAASGGDPLQVVSDQKTIAEQLAKAGIRFRHFAPDRAVGAGDSQADILAAYREAVDAVMADEGFQTVDVISLKADHPDKAAIRQKFLREHIHTEDEVRIFVDGCGLFYMHIGDAVYSVLCEKGDFISVPANTLHWFDTGPNPVLAAIRFFNNPEGWVAQYSGDSIADTFPYLEN